MTTSDVLDNTFNPIQDFGITNKTASPLTMGAGHINPNKALDPDLIYDMTIEDYVSPPKQIQIITKSSSNSCSNSSLDLNYPSFIAFFSANDSNSGVKIVQEFRRMVTYVGDGKSTYTAKLGQWMGYRSCLHSPNNQGWCYCNIMMLRANCAPISA
ncbi:hypothetical protein RJ640_009844 [Escallonia rubra]|uniref:Subtilisin-like protease fibronectin type-III domain-containing protein n=1 Tax=Escallonia rubra TaxID=112253 RepID=A0AA88U2S7_9ASTE|nr:hypothetical protein RJ640_009844 [Escallonia rubra]